jgi:CrcB protein
MMIRTLFLIGIGGLIGSIARYLTTSFFNKVFTSPFPYGTFFVNIAGCLIIGFVYGLSERFNWFTSEWRLFFATGICGGFTTFSAFAYENMRLIQTGNFFVFVSYSIASVGFGLLAVFIGLTLIKLF